MKFESYCIIFCFQIIKNCSLYCSKGRKTTKHKITCGITWHPETCNCHLLNSALPGDWTVNALSWPVEINFRGQANTGIIITNKDLYALHMQPAMCIRPSFIVNIKTLNGIATKCISLVGYGERMLINRIRHGQLIHMYSALIRTYPSRKIRCYYSIILQKRAGP